MLDSWVERNRNVSQFYIKNDFIPILRPIIPVFQISNIPENSILLNVDLFEVCPIKLYFPRKIKVLFAVQDVFYLDDQFAVLYVSV